MWSEDLSDRPHIFEVQFLGIWKGPAMTAVLRADGDPERDDEPTPGAGPCVEDWGLLDEEEARQIHAILDAQEYNYYDLLVYEGEYEVFLRVFVGLDCLRLEEVRVRGCGEIAERVKELIDLPEFTRIALEGECVEVASPADLRMRIEKALERLGLRAPLSPIAYRAVRRLVRDY